MQTEIASSLRLHGHGYEKEASNTATAIGRDLAKKVSVNMLALKRRLNHVGCHSGGTYFEVKSVCLLYRRQPALGGATRSSITS